MVCRESTALKDSVHIAADPGKCLVSGKTALLSGPSKGQEELSVHPMTTLPSEPRDTQFTSSANTFSC